MAALMTAALICGQAETAPDVELQKRTKILLEIHPLTATHTSPTADDSFQLEVDREGSAKSEFSLLWPKDAGQSRVVVRALQTLPSAEWNHAVQIFGELTLPDGRRVHASRLIEFDERSTTLFELFRSEEQSLILAIEAETTVETVLPGRSVVGAPVLFKLEIQRVEGEETFSLETNLMRTFIGEAVAYSFRLGSTPDSDSALISLTPARLLGGIAEIEIEVSGILPGPEGPIILARKQQWHASRGAATSLSFVSGEPAVGYRFLVSADF
jgi:hypothetical protein